MRNTRQQEDVRQAGIDAAVGRGIRRVIQRRFLGGISREEAGVVAVLVVGERDETEVGKLKLAGFGDHHLRGDLHLVAGAEVIQVDGQVLHGTTSLRATDLHTPAVVDKAFYHVGGEGERGVGPQVFVVIRAFDLLNVVEAAHRHGIRAVRQTPQHARHHQTEVTGIIGFAEGFPFDVLGPVEVVANILDGRHLLHILF